MDSSTCISSGAACMSSFPLGITFPSKTKARPQNLNMDLQVMGSHYPVLNFPLPFKIHKNYTVSDSVTHKTLRDIFS